ncbi:hypothetical protein DOM21_15500 [Bacteriovorax stolpii]|uniref:Uncharacterized protein n=1 Tax=Bacteriovorax stolpii TaxID=960 RepID=A0A2K9NP08_BACTC|nr:transporter substrate-binding domain-containing protein [Bacteriovorax stolpii]AUN97232.1 hypothetical protein C0V70_03725 [Bacteriovorax stolpii]QDK42829.1 hypothetical protein DOM21_15500 [Bacteriovorax stolpii]TDP53521.1 amino acid ABC transporter substrate-binding protein (PAAT family) [Bacteriovorax stolpii]
MNQVLSVLLLFSSVASAKTLKVAFGENRPPYVFSENGEVKGIEVDVVREALLQSGHAIDFSTLPAKRLEMASNKMPFDIAVGVLEQRPNLFYSTDYLQMKYYAVAKLSKEVRLERINDLQRYSVGAWPFAWKYCGDEYRRLYTPKADGSFALHYTEPVTSESQNKMFWLNRFDVSITNKVTFNYYKKILSSAYDTSVDISYYDIIPEEVKFSVAFKDEQIKKDFEAGLSQLKRNKRFRRIFDSYIR